MNNNNTISTVEESLQHIAIRLDEMSGNAFGVSRLNVSSDTDFSEDVAKELEILNTKFDELNNSLATIANRMEDLEFNLRSLSTISDTMENLLGWYIQFNQPNNK
jgi:archaellum component FlaC